LTEECENLEKSQDRRNNAKKCKITDVESEKEFVFPAFEFCGCTSPRIITSCNGRVWNNKFEIEVLQ